MAVVAAKYFSRLVGGIYRNCIVADSRAHSLVGSDLFVAQPRDLSRRRLSFGKIFHDATGAAACRRNWQADKRPAANRRVDRACCAPATPNAPVQGSRRPL